MHDGKPGDTGMTYALHCPYPQLQVRIDGVLDKHHHISVFQRSRNLVQGKGIHTGSCPYPDSVNAVLEGFIDMLLSGYLHGNGQTQFIPDAPEPPQSR